MKAKHYHLPSTEPKDQGKQLIFMYRGADFGIPIQINSSNYRIYGNAQPYVPNEQAPDLTYTFYVYTATAIDERTQAQQQQIDQLSKENKDLSSKFDALQIQLVQLNASFINLQEQVEK